MVSRRRLAADRRGKARLGGLVFLLFLAVAIYYGVGLGTVYYKYWTLKDEMRQQARLAAGLDDETIHRRILRKVESLELPAEAHNITVRRMTHPRQIVIRTSYPDTLYLPFYRRAIRLTPEARQPL